MTDGAQRQPQDARRIWVFARRVTTAFVIAAFPLVFIMDRSTSGTSPVLPGLIALAVLIAVLPILLTEGVWLRLRRLDRHRLETRLYRMEQSARLVLGTAIAWLVAWFALGG